MLLLLSPSPTGFVYAYCYGCMLQLQSVRRMQVEALCEAASVPLKRHRKLRACLSAADLALSPLRDYRTKKEDSSIAVNSEIVYCEGPYTETLIKYKLATHLQCLTFRAENRCYIVSILSCSCFLHFCCVSKLQNLHCHHGPPNQE